MDLNIKNLLNKKQYKQRTKEWYEKRYNMLTASEIAPILDANPYMDKLELLVKKCKKFDINDNFSNPATEWGVKYEPIAIQNYENISGERVNEVGLFEHDNYNWLGASPDGLCDSGKLVEIKCVWRRKITDDIPLYYWMQVQIQLEVCDLEECDLFQCKFIEYKNKTEYINDTKTFAKGIIRGKKNIYWKLDKYSLHTIKRDREWFNNYLLILNNFWNDIIYYRENGFNELKTYNHDDINFVNNKKRANHLIYDDNPTDFKRQKYLDEDWTKWIDAKSVKNYIINDPLLDWLNMYYDDNYYNKFNKINNNFNDYLFKKNSEFKTAIIKNLNMRFVKNIVNIANTDEKFSIKKYYNTVNAIKQGIPIILNGILHNKNNNTYGIPDIILRTDYLDKIFNNQSVKNNQGIKNNQIIKNNQGIKNNQSIKNNQGIKNNYCIINIKCATLILNNNNIVNTNNVSCYKSEIIILNEALEHILGHLPKKAYIIGKKYKNKDKKIYNHFNYLAEIDIEKYDKNLVDRTHTAINWLKDLKNNGSKWDIYKPHRWELYPNMSNNFDYPWHNLKIEISNKIEEITMLWNCGVRERKIAHSNGIYSWKNITSSILNFKGQKGKILDNIIGANLLNKYNIVGNNFKIKKDKLQFYVDFETVNTTYNNFDNIINYRKNKKYITDDTSMIYMIGIGWENPLNNKWVFKHFITDRLNHKCEKKIILDLNNYMNDIKNKFNIKNNVKVYHWSNAEVIEYNKAIIRHNIKNVNINWVDLLEYFKINCVAIKGVYNYGLKSIANSLYNYKKIKTKWPDSSLDGAQAMLVAWNCEEKCLNKDGKKLGEFPEMNEIVKYNEIDCKALWDILKLFSN